MAKSGGAESSSPERDEYSDEEEMTKEDFLKNFSGLSKGIQEEIVAQIKENKKSSTSELESVMEEVNQEVNDFYTAQDIQNQKDSQETMSDDDEEGTVKTKNDGAEETKEETMEQETKEEMDDDMDDFFKSANDFEEKEDSQDYTEEDWIDISQLDAPCVKSKILNLRLSGENPGEI